MRVSGGAVHEDIGPARANVHELAYRVLSIPFQPSKSTPFTPMKIFTTLTLVLLGLITSGATAHAAPTAAEIIAQARAKLGPETKLTAVKTLLFEGKSFDKDAKPVGIVQLQYKLPNKRREYVLRNDRTLEVILGTDGIEGFVTTRNLNSGEQRIRPAEGYEVKTYLDQFLADTEFYAPPKRGQVTYVGEARQQGKTCHALEYKYPGGLIFKRFFDKGTLLLVATEIYAENTPADNRRLLVEEGELIVDGIRFPKKTTVYTAGKKESHVEFTQVKINENIPDSVFAFPMP
jgi:outer membrane lipoprotein-sorting protein